MYNIKGVYLRYSMIHALMIAVGRINSKQLQDAQSWDVKVTNKLSLCLIEIWNTLSFYYWPNYWPNTCSTWVVSRTWTAGRAPIRGQNLWHWLTEHRWTTTWFLLLKVYTVCLQANGDLMWFSLTPKYLHVSSRWMIITDYRKKVSYNFGHMKLIASKLFQPKYNSKHTAP